MRCGVNRIPDSIPREAAVIQLEVLAAVESDQVLVPVGVAIQKALITAGEATCSLDECCEGTEEGSDEHLGRRGDQLANERKHRALTPGKLTDLRGRFGGGTQITVQEEHMIECVQQGRIETIFLGTSIGADDQRAPLYRGDLQGCARSHRLLQRQNEE